MEWNVTLWRQEPRSHGGNAARDFVSLPILLSPPLLKCSPAAAGIEQPFPLHTVTHYSDGAQTQNMAHAIQHSGNDFNMKVDAAMLQPTAVFYKGKPFSLASLDMTLPLSKILNRIHTAVDRTLLFYLRLDHCLPYLLSPSSSAEHKVIAAYLCHLPYRSVTADPSCHPFSSTISALISSSDALPSSVLSFIQTLLNGSNEQVEALGARTALDIASGDARDSNSAVVQRELELIRKSMGQTLSMTEQRHILTYLSSPASSVDRASTAPLRLCTAIVPSDLVSAAAHNPTVCCDMVGRLCHEAVEEAHGVASIPVSWLQGFFSSLQKLSPSLRSFDLVTRLLRSDRCAPVPWLSPVQASQDHEKNLSSLTTTVAHLTRSWTLGGFLSNGIGYLERRESDEEVSIINEAREAGLGVPDRREVEERLEERMSRDVSIFCHFVRSLINAALLFAPDMGPLRRQIAGLADRGYPADGVQALTQEVEAIEDELVSGSQAMVIELQHFALRFGRYRDGTRLYAELNALS